MLKFKNKDKIGRIHKFRRPYCWQARNLAKNGNKQGVTLIEFLVVIALIGLLSTGAVIVLGNMRAKARDSKRIHDLKLLQKAIELHIHDVGYPPFVRNIPPNRWDCSGGAPTCLKKSLEPYLPLGLPEDPKSRKWIYCHRRGTISYLIATSLEQNVEVAGDLDAVNNWSASECIASDDGLVLGAQPNCSDNNGGTIDSDTNVSAICLGSDDSG